MKSLSKISICLVICSFFIAAPMVQAQKIKGNGNVIKQERSVSSFSGLEIKGVFNIFLSQGDKESVTVEADENLMDIIQTNNEGNTLILKLEKNRNIKSSTKMNIYVTIKDINRLEILGVGKVKTTNALDLDNLKLKISGVGNTSLNVNCTTLEGDLSMVGSFSIEGKADNVTLRNSGVGSIKAFDFVTQNLDIKNSGIGKVEIRAEKALNISSSGIGGVEYKGNATIGKMKSSGIGKVKKVN